MMLSIITLFSFLQFLQFSAVLSTSQCPKSCELCFSEVLQCTKSGLTSIPTDINADITKITLIGHTFHNSILSRANFSTFSKPKYSITQLSLRKSNIEIIEPNTFYDLSGLDNLDLSDNWRIVIKYMAFANLKLKLLKLDNIEYLELQKGAFEDLQIVSLSMKKSHLKTLDFDLFRPISSKLSSLFLSNNLLTYLEPKFDQLFQQVTNLDLSGNLFECNCNLAWLGQVLQDRIQRTNADQKTFSYSGVYAVYPRCTGPLFIRKRFIHNITKDEFSCSPPSLELVNIHFENSELVRLSCSASVISKRAPFEIMWHELSKDNQNQENQLISPPEVKSSESNNAVVLVKKTAQTNWYICIAKSNSGNSTIRVAINWPPNGNVSLPTNGRKNSEHFNEEIITSKNFFFREQFTLLEMLGAVMGTFTITLTVFLLLYRFCVRVNQKAKKTNSLKKSGYSVYEPPVYSDSQTYDVPQNTYPNYSQTLLNKCIPLSTTPSHYIDYRTQQRISQH